MGACHSQSIEEVTDTSSDFLRRISSLLLESCLVRMNPLQRYNPLVTSLLYIYIEAMIGFIYSHSESTIFMLYYLYLSLKHN